MYKGRCDRIWTVKVLSVTSVLSAGVWLEILSRWWDRVLLCPLSIDDAAQDDNNYEEDNYNNDGYIDLPGEASRCLFNWNGTIRKMVITLLNLRSYYRNSPRDTIISCMWIAQGKRTVQFSPHKSMSSRWEILQHEKCSRQCIGWS